MPTVHKFLVVGGIALAAYMLIAYAQRNLGLVPGVGAYLPR